MEKKKISVLFVCLGNICRSPMAEGVFGELAKEKGWEGHFFIDSAGTSAYHLGEPPHHRSCATALSHGITLTHRARQLVPEDFSRFDYIMAMDGNNLQNILKARPPGDMRAVTGKIREYDHTKSGTDVADPYLEGMPGFEACYKILHECCQNFLEALAEAHQLPRH